MRFFASLVGEVSMSKNSHLENLSKQLHKIIRDVPPGIAYAELRRNLKKSLLSLEDVCASTAKKAVVSENTNASLKNLQGGLGVQVQSFDPNSFAVTIGMLDQMIKKQEEELMELEKKSNVEELPSKLISERNKGAL